MRERQNLREEQLKGEREQEEIYSQRAEACKIGDLLESFYNVILSDIIQSEAFN